MGEFARKDSAGRSGVIILARRRRLPGGIGVAGMAGMSKESEMSDEQKRYIIKEFDFKKGIVVATFSGVMSASFSYGLAAGDPIKLLTTPEHGTASCGKGCRSWSSYCRAASRRTASGAYC